MSDIATEPLEEAEIALEVELDAAPEKVWRAVAIAAFRERWLPEADLAEPEPIASIPGVEVRYRMRENGAPFPESTVTFRIEPGPQGGALLRIIHRIEDGAHRTSANDNLRPMSLSRDAIWPNQGRHCERSEAIQGNVGRRATPGSPRRFAPRDDDSIRTQFSLAA
jgi:hypothetical protein